MYVCIFRTDICDFFICFRLYLFVRAPFAQDFKEVDRGRPSGHGRRGSGVTRAVCLAWRALKVFFSARVDKTIFRGVLCEEL